MKFIDVYVTCPSRQVAARIARTCVDERLAACANVGEQIESVYRWQDLIEEAVEFPLTLKTRASRFDRLSARIKAEHPYDTPCIIATDIAAIDPAYAQWLEQETAE